MRPAKTVLWKKKKSQLKGIVISSFIFHISYPLILINSMSSLQVYSKDHFKVQIYLPSFRISPLLWNFKMLPGTTFKNIWKLLDLNDEDSFVKSLCVRDRCVSCFWSPFISNDANDFVTRFFSHYRAPEVRSYKPNLEHSYNPS